jgi:hypothetical protein
MRAFDDADAAEQTLAAVWSNLFALFPDTALEDDAEELGWAFVNLFHRAALKRSGQVDRATDEIRCLIATGDGSEVHTSQLENEIARAQAAEAAMLALEGLRETAARLYLNETGRSWRPAGGSRANHGAALTSAAINGRDFLRARAESGRRAVTPEGTPVVFAGGRFSFPTTSRPRHSPATSGTPSTRSASMLPTWFWSMAATPRASTVWPLPGQSGARSRSLLSRSTRASGNVRGSAATNKCSRLNLAT